MAIQSIQTKSFLLEMGNKDYCPLLVTEFGSYLYGTNHKDSDYDLRAVYVDASMERLFLGNVDETYNSPNGDYVGFTALKFLRMYLKGSPNVLDILFAPPLYQDDYCYPFFELMKNEFNPKFFGASLGQAKAPHRDLKDLRSQVRGLQSALLYYDNQLSYPLSFAPQLMQWTEQELLEQKVLLQSKVEQIYNEYKSYTQPTEKLYDYYYQVMKFAFHIDY